MMLLSSSSPLLSTFAVVLALASVISAQSLSFTWPKYPEANVDFALTWSGGTPPYTVYVLTPELTKYYYKYQGSDVSTTYDFPLNVGTKVAFQCRDSAELIVTSPTITVVATLNLQYPSNPQTGVSATIQWSGGVSPYIAYVLTPDLTKYYWKYTGSGTNQNWTPEMNGGTQVVFQVIDLNGVKVTSDPVTVQGNGDSSESSLSVLSTMSVASVNSIASLSSSAQPTSSSPADTTTAPPSTALGGTPTTATGGGGGGSSGPVKGGPSSRTSTTTSSQPNQTPGSPSGGSGNVKKSSTNIAAIAGGVAGGVGGLALIALLAFFFVKRGAAKAEKNNYDSGERGGGQGEKPTGEPALPNVGPLDGEYTPGAGAGADVGGGARGVGVGENPLTPELPGAAYPGGGGGGEGFNPAYAGAAGYAAGAGAGAGAYYQVQNHNQGDPRYSIPASPPPPGTDGNYPMSAAYPSGLQQPLPQSVSYGPQAAGAAFAVPDGGSSAHLHPGQSQSYSLPPTPNYSSGPSSGFDSENGTSLPHTRSPHTGAHDVSSEYPSMGSSGGGGHPGSYGPAQQRQTPGWAGLPEVQS